MGEKLSDMHINYAQELLKRQFPSLSGLESTLLVAKEGFKATETENKLQILHTRKDHWITASNINCAADIINVYDSLYSSVDKTTENVLYNLFPLSTRDKPVIKVHLYQRQKGVKDCGLFAIASATSIALECDLLLKIKYNQAALRPHLLTCIKNDNLVMFPTLL